MKIGFCGGFNAYEAIKEAGYDFIEMPVIEVMADHNDEVYERKREKLKQMELSRMAFNSLVPGSFSIIGSYMDGSKDVLEYCKVAIERIADLEGKIIVFGSGKARMVPDGIDFDKATDILIKFVRDCADFAMPYGITIAVEHLNKDESNILTSVKETGEFVKTVNRENVKILYDTYHMSVEGEDIANVAAVIDDVVHVHVSDKEGRTYPHKDLKLYNELNALLKEAEYKGAISVECRVDDLKRETKLAMETIKRTFNFI